jgi:hypothetical protein
LPFRTGALRKRVVASWIADAHRGDEKRFVVHADDKLTAFLKLEPATRTDERRI